MHIFKSITHFSVLSAVSFASAWSVAQGTLQRRQAFDQNENDIGGGEAWIIPANLSVTDVGDARAGDGWVPLNTYLHKQGIKPLTDQHSHLDIEEDMASVQIGPWRRSALLSKRAEDTRVNMGRRLVDYGCAASIRKPIEESLNALCNRGFCDESVAYTRTVDWLPEGKGNFGSGMGRRQLKVTIEGDYRGSRTKGNFIEAAKLTVNPDTVAHGDRSMKIDTTTCLHYGICEIVECRMSKFGDFISISKLEDFDTYIEIDMRVELYETNNRCLASNILGAVGGAISGIAGGFFGVAKALNPGC